MGELKVGIMGAMSEEIEGILELIDSVEEIKIGNRTYFEGKINEIKVVLVFSRWGKVAASSTVSTLIHHFRVNHILFTGVAGAIMNDLEIGDIIIGKRYIQHDLDARPLMKQFEIPLLEKTFIEADQQLLQKIEKAVCNFSILLKNKQVISDDILSKFNIESPRILIGDIASGDQFFSSIEQKNQLISLLPTILCVEMEGAAVAQVCFENGIPFCIIRTISDTADHDAHIDFPKFLKEVSGKFSSGIIKEYFKLIGK
jgi:adenosylhomocysteine nucleosidase